VLRTWTADVVKVDGGREHTCALTADQEIYCWGANAEGQLGQNNTVDSATPVLVPIDWVGWIELASGWDFVCALDGYREAYCWGNNDANQLGVIGTDDKLVPTYVRSSSAAMALSAGEEHACLVRADGVPMCWGGNWSGQLGQGDFADHVERAFEITGIDDAVGVTAGYEHTCVVRASGAVSCWGGNWAGQLGNGSGVDIGSPVEVVGLDDAVAISSAEDTVCTLRENGGIACWGYNEDGEVGDGTNIGAFTPQHVELIP
jgi:alpha-tubulin suppressor-like RCC1 family protein